MYALDRWLRSRALPVRDDAGIFLQKPRYVNQGANREETGRMSNIIRRAVIAGFTATAGARRFRA